MNELPDAPAVSFRLLGKVEAYAGGVPLKLGPDQERCLLVILLANRGHWVNRDRLIKAVWDDRPPKDDLDALWRLVYRLRDRLGRAGLTGALGKTGATYRLDVPPERVDLHCFREMTAAAYRLAGHDDLRAGALLEEALDLYRGEPLADLKGTWIDAYRHTITEEHHVAETTMYEIALRLDKARQVVPQLAALFRERPDDQSVAWYYMHALYRAGRPDDALAVYRRLSARLRKEHGTDSLKALTDLHERMLKDDPGLRLPDAVAIPFGRPKGESREDSGHAAEDAENAENAAENAKDGKNTEDAVNGTEDGDARRHTYITAENANIIQAPVNLNEGFNFYTS